MGETTPLIQDESAIPIPTRVTKDIYTYQPPTFDTSPAADPNAPKLIIIFGWMDAPTKHVAKYMAGYAKLYPYALQVLATSKQSIYWSRREKKLDTVRPIMQILEEKGFFSASPPNLLVHVFSDGGAVQINLLSELIRESHTPSLNTISPPATVLIFDSLPGDGRLGPGLDAHTSLIRSPIIKYLAYIPLTILWSIVMGSAFLLRKPDPITAFRNGLNRVDVFPWTNEKTPRVYIYSKEDRIVYSSAVEEHIAQARTFGLSVTTELFKGSSHVSHMRKDPIRYWQIIPRIWEDALKVQRSLL